MESFNRLLKLPPPPTVENLMYAPELNSSPMLGRTPGIWFLPNMVEAPISGSIGIQGIRIQIQIHEVETIAL